MKPAQPLQLCCGSKIFAAGKWAKLWTASLDAAIRQSLNLLVLFSAGFFVPSFLSGPSHQAMA
ncbi:MAG: hypothetical protein WDN46_05665 [Methylocella sp.]